jgi:hypothetical protein
MDDPAQFANDTVRISEPVERLTLSRQPLTQTEVDYHFTYRERQS